MDKPVLIGRVEQLDFPRHKLRKVPARIDTGAKTSAIWASGIREKDGRLRYVLFDKKSPFYSGEVLRTRSYEIRLVSNSTGHIQRRYAVKLPVVVKGRRIRATFTLADRSTQVYPVLVGRNILRGKFVVNVKLGRPLRVQEKLRSRQIKQTFRKSRKETA